MVRNKQGESSSQMQWKDTEKVKAAGIFNGKKKTRRRQQLHLMERNRQNKSSSQTQWEKTNKAKGTAGRNKKEKEKANAPATPNGKQQTTRKDR